MKNIITTLKVNPYNWLFAIILLFTPFTELRFSRVGLSELAVILCFLLLFVIKKNTFKMNFPYTFSKFWILYLTVILISMYINFLFGTEEVVRLNKVIIDIFAYVFILVLCVLIEYLVAKKSFSAYLIIKRTFFMSAFILPLLFIIGMIGNGQMRKLIFYYTYYSPFATNIHHTSMYIGPVAFSGLLVFFQEKSKKTKMLSVFGMIALLYLLSRTGSTKSQIILYLGLLLIPVTYIWHYISKVKHLKPFLVGIVAIMTLGFLLFFIDTLFDLIFNFFVSNDGSGARGVLYTFSFKKAIGSLLVGYGPGPHAQFIYGINSDAHQTFLQTFLQGGIIGVVLFMLLYIKIIIRTLKTNYFLLPMLSAISIYILGGDILRRLPIWIFLLLIYYYQNDLSNE